MMLIAFISRDVSFRDDRPVPSYWEPRHVGMGHDDLHAFMRFVTLRDPLHTTMG
jgi:hypothetical protein